MNINEGVVGIDHQNAESEENWAGTERFEIPPTEELRVPDTQSSQKFRVDVETTLAKLLAQEDTDGDGRITVKDTGPKKFSLFDVDRHQEHIISGTYYLGNLLQELSLAKEAKVGIALIDETIINEDAVTHVSGRIKDMFWDRLTRRLDESLIAVAAPDSKSREVPPRPRIYIPPDCPQQYEYYVNIAKARPQLNLDVQCLPSGKITPKFMKEIFFKPGLLALGMKTLTNGSDGNTKQLQGLGFVVPGDRFNEFYGWDSYFCARGLLQLDRTTIAKDMVSNFVFEIKHYGKILNANRSYYLLRSQPPFLTDLAIRVYKRTTNDPDAKDFLKTAIIAAIKEYETVWMAEPRFDTKTGLSRFRSEDRGLLPEVGYGQYDNDIEPHARRLGLSIAEFTEAYQTNRIRVPEFDTFLMHDCASRESGHDTSYRVKSNCADLATIDLNCLLYKYEIDISWAISTVFEGRLEIPGAPDSARESSSELWDQRAQRRKQAIDKFLWNESKGSYFDYDTLVGEQSTYETATAFYALWCGVASTAQAQQLIDKALPRLEQVGGITVGTEESRGPLTAHRPQLQWDFPYGWAPHQMLAWDGFINYGYHEDAQRLAYRWLHMITKSSMDFNGAVVEKYDVTQLEDSINVQAEYGNQGANFQGVAQEGRVLLSLSGRHMDSSPH